MYLFYQSRIFGGHNRLLTDAQNFFIPGRFFSSSSFSAESLARNSSRFDRLNARASIVFLFPAKPQKVGQWISTTSHRVGPCQLVEQEGATPPSLPPRVQKSAHDALCPCFINLCCSELSEIFRRINYWIYLVLYSYLKYEPVSVVNQCARSAVRSFIGPR